MCDHTRILTGCFASIRVKRLFKLKKVDSTKWNFEEAVVESKQPPRSSRVTAVMKDQSALDDEDCVIVGVRMTHTLAPAPKLEIETEDEDAKERDLEDEGCELGDFHAQFSNTSVPVLLHPRVDEVPQLTADIARLSPQVYCGFTYNVKAQTFRLTLAGTGTISIHYLAVVPPSSLVLHGVWTAGVASDFLKRVCSLSLHRVLYLCFLCCSQ